MIFLTAQFMQMLHDRKTGRNVSMLVHFGVALVAVMSLFAVLFHLIMQYEGRPTYSWLDGYYWLMVTMSTLGYGDIVFETQLGRMFSIVVIFSGLIFLLAFLPAIFIEFFYMPWMKAQAEARAPRRLHRDVSGHVILTHLDPVTRSLMQKLKRYQIEYVLLVDDVQRALQLHDEGFNVMVGPNDDPRTYRNMNIDRAALVACTGTDTSNTNIAFTVREQCDSVPIIATASLSQSVDILELAGATHVLQLAQALGESLARRTIGGDAQAHMIGNFHELRIAEATPAGTPLVGKTLAESKLREQLGLIVVGVWERGRFILPKADTKIAETTVLVMAGSAEQFRRYDELFCIYHQAAAPAVIIGGGRVGRAAGAALAAQQMEYRIVEKLPERVRDPDLYVVGDAAEIEVIKKAGIEKTHTVFITTHDDDTNIYLTIYCRRLRPDVQIITRSTHERNVSTLHRAGADFVMSYANMGSSSIFNWLRKSDVLMVAEGLNVFRVALPPALVDKRLVDTSIRDETGCSVIAIQKGDQLEPTPDPYKPLLEGTELVLIGTVEAEQTFFEIYGSAKQK